MSLSDLVSISVSVNTRTPTATGFGRTCLLGYTTRFADNYRLYSELSEMSDDGFTSNEPLYLMAAALFSQNPRPEDVMVARMTSAHTHTQDLTITTATEGAVISFELVSPDGTVNTISRTVPAASTLTAEAVAVEALVEACSGVASSPSVAVITITPVTPGGLIRIRNLVNCTLSDTTTDQNYDTRMATILTESASVGGFYFCAIDVNSEANVDDMAAWAQANRKMFFWQTQNSNEAAGSGTMGTQQVALGYDYAASFYVYDLGEYATCAAASFCGSRDPGSYTLALKELIGCSALALSTTQEANLRAAGYNYVSTVAGLSMVLGPNNGGTTLGGEYVDIVHGTDAMTARMQERCVTVLANNDKVLYSDAGADLLVAQVRGVLADFVTSGLLLAGTTSASAVAASSQSTVNRGNRYFPGIKFAAQYAGAIQKAGITGTLTV